MNITFHRIKNNELETVLQLFKETAEKIYQMGIDHWQYWKNPPKEKIKWVEEGIDNHEFFFIKASNNEHLGMVRILNEDLLYWGEQEHKAKYIHSLVVKEKYNGKGFGIKIINAIEHQAKEDNCKYLRLDADAKNPKLCNYYEKMGFNKVRTVQLPLSTYHLYEKALNTKSTTNDLHNPVPE